MRKNRQSVLYLGTNRLYMNPTIQLIYKAVGASTDLTLYGPGFQSQEVLAQGVNNFVSKHGPYDFLLTDGVVLFFKNLKPFLTSYNYFDIYSIRKYLDDMKSYFISSQQKKLFYPAIDYYNVSRGEIKAVEESGCYLITWGPEFHEYLKHCDAIRHESFMGKDLNDNWIEFLLKNQEKVISIPQIIDNSEFNFLPLASKRYDIGIPGAGYYHRREALKQLKIQRQN